jgi:hypothetical protein
VVRSRGLLLLLLAGCAGSGDPPAGEIRAAAVIDHARVLASEIGPRPYDTEPARRAAEYVEQQLAGLAVERLPVGHVELPPIDVGPFRWMGPRTIEVGDPNLLVRFAGTTPGPALLYMAHVDTVPGSPGAADNAASVGILIELARALRVRPPARPVLIAFTAAEEGGLAGARALAAQLAVDGPSVGLAVSLDMVGSARTTLNGLGPLIGRRWLIWIAARVAESGADVEAPVPHRVVSRLAPAAERSDHGAFTERGVPAFHLYGRGPDRIYLAYHTAWDLPERLDAAAIDSAARLVIALARTAGDLPAPGGDPGFWLPGTGVVVPGLLVYAVEAALAAVALFLLFIMWRRGGPRARGRGIGLVAVSLVVALAWAVATVALVLAGGDHPMAWVHAPGTALALAIALAVSAAALAWLSPLGRLPLVGRRRYAVAGVLPLLLAGAGLFALGAHELAWMPLATAALLAAAALAPGRAVPLIVLALSLVPLSPALSPAFLRECAFNGFFPPGFPLPLFVAAILTPHAMVAVPLVARALPPRTALPRWALALPAALLVALAIAAALATRAAPCDAGSFTQLGLACEIAPE